MLPRQFCGVYTSLAADIKGHARRGSHVALVGYVSEQVGSIGNKLEDTTEVLS